MRKFKDTTGREWEIVLTIGSAKRVKDHVGVDLLQPEEGDPPLLTRLGTEERLLAEVICCLMSNQFEKHNVGEEEVLDAFDGATILAAQKAFYGELVDFFRSRGRKDRATAVEKQETVIAQAIDLMDARIKEYKVDLTALGDPSGRSQEF